MKIATNLSLPVQLLAFTEGILLAEKSGIPREVALEVLLNSVAGSPAVSRGRKRASHGANASRPNTARMQAASTSAEERKSSPDGSHAWQS